MRSDQSLHFLGLFHGFRKLIDPNGAEERQIGLIEHAQSITIIID